jgi:acyl-CoA thioester hydrolase
MYTAGVLQFCFGSLHYVMHPLHRASQPTLRHLPIEITALLYCDNAAPDFSGIVYHANYLRFMERGRTNHLRLLGAEQHALFAEAQAETPGFAFVVRSMQIDYLKPARMDDILDIVTWPVAVKGASITLAQEVRKAADVLVKAEVRVAFISEGRAQPIPKALRVLMKADLI